jgi:hypothetical protein
VETTTINFHKWIKQNYPHFARDIVAVIAFITTNKPSSKTFKERTKHKLRITGFLDFDHRPEF